MDANEYDLVVIGSGPAGQKSAIGAAKLRKKAAIIALGCPIAKRRKLTCHSEPGGSPVRNLLSSHPSRTGKGTTFSRAAKRDTLYRQYFLN